MKKILIVFGTRPEAIKMAPLILELKSDISSFCVSVCITGQHRELVSEVLTIFGITADFDLDIMTSEQEITQIVSAVIIGVTEVINKTRPDIVLVHGDTATAAGASLTAFFKEIPVGHVEAGLRTYNLKAPFPEEFNRQIIAKASRWHFAPTATNEANLISENIPRNHIHVTGNTVVDALQLILQKISSDPKKKQEIVSNLNSQLPFESLKGSIVLVTCHRRENFGAGISNVCQAIKQIAEENKDIHFVYPVHPNPKVNNVVNNILSGLSNVYIIAPLPYTSLVYLLSKTKFVMTDSGGIQEEAPSLNIPVLVMRDVSERVEAIESGFVRLIGTELAGIVDSVRDCINSDWGCNDLESLTNPYGDGTASRRIASFLMQGDGEAF